MSLHERHALFERLESAYLLYGVLWRLAEAVPSVAPAPGFAIQVLEQEQRKWWPARHNLGQSLHNDANGVTQLQQPGAMSERADSGLAMSSRKASVTLPEKSDDPQLYAQAYHWLAQHDTEMRLWLQERTGEAEVEIVPEDSSDTRVRIRFLIPANLRVLVKDHNERLVTLRRSFLDTCRRDKHENQLQDLMRVCVHNVLVLAGRLCHLTAFCLSARSLPFLCVCVTMGVLDAVDTAVH